MSIILSSTDARTREQKSAGATSHATSHLIMGAASCMQTVFQMMLKISQSREPVMIVGETGTGKELVARCIHGMGRLGHQPFVVVDCPTLAPHLIESELFGYVRGAFTGAFGNKQGLFGASAEGTVFLDDITELPIEQQAKLLRAIQEQEVRPVGSTRWMKFHARVIAASNRDLEMAVEERSFRQDLYYRLNVLTLRLPPLRHRKGDILLLARYFLQKYSPAEEPPLLLAEDAAEFLLAYDWPGNVRELENCIRRGIVYSTGGVITLEDLPPTIRRPEAVRLSPADEKTLSMQEVERQAILRALADAGGDRILAARMLGISKTTIYRKLKEYGTTRHGALSGHFT